MITRDLDPFSEEHISLRIPWEYVSLLARFSALLFPVWLFAKDKRFFNRLNTARSLDNLRPLRLPEQEEERVIADVLKLFLQRQFDEASRHVSKRLGF